MLNMSKILNLPYLLMKYFDYDTTMIFRIIVKTCFYKMYLFQLLSGMLYNTVNLLYQKLDRLIRQ